MMCLSSTRSLFTHPCFPFLYLQLVPIVFTLRASVAVTLITVFCAAEDVIQLTATQRDQSTSLKIDVPAHNMKLISWCIKKKKSSPLFDRINHEDPFNQ